MLIVHRLPGGLLIYFEDRICFQSNYSCQHYFGGSEGKELRSGALAKESTRMSSLVTLIFVDQH